MNKLKVDKVLLIVTIVLVILGLLMVYSASNVVALYKYNNSFYFIKRQLIFAGIGIVLMILIINIDINKIYKYSSIIFLIALVCLILVLIPGIGMVRGGACCCYPLHKGKFRVIWQHMALLIRRKLHVKVVSYARYSSDMQSESSIVTQQIAIRKYCSSNGYTLLEEFSDAAISGTDVSNRYGFQDMIRYVTENKVDAVVVYTRDRFSRSISDFLNYLEILEHHDCRLICVNGMNDETPSGKLSEWINIALSEFYVKNLSREVIRGMKYNIEVGKSNGGFDLLGYDIDPKTKKYIINQQEAMIVKLIFKMFVEGKSYKQITNYLYDNGYRRKDGRPIKMTNRQILTNRKYIGENRSIFINSGVVEEVKAFNVIPPIIDMKTFDKAQDIINSRKNRSIRVYKSLLSGILVCGYTGASFCETLITKKSFGHRSTIYRNSSKAKFEKHLLAKEINGNTLNDYVLCLIEETLLNEKNSTFIYRLMKKAIDKKMSKIVDEIRKLEYENVITKEHYLDIVRELAKANVQEHQELLSKLESISTKLNNDEVKRVELNSQKTLLPTITKEQTKLIMNKLLSEFINSNNKNLVVKKVFHKIKLFNDNVEFWLNLGVYFNNVKLIRKNYMHAVFSVKRSEIKEFVKLDNLSFVDINELGIKVVDL